MQAEGGMGIKFGDGVLSKILGPLFARGDEVMEEGWKVGIGKIYGD